MLNFLKVAPWDQSLTNLTKFNTSILGLNSSFDLMEVDTRDFSIDKIVSHEHETNFDISDAAYLSTDFSRGYYFCHRSKIETEKGDIISSTNSKAEFVKGIDGHLNSLVFSKYHKVHKKFSINFQQFGHEKRVAMLFDLPLQKIHIVR